MNSAALTHKADAKVRAALRIRDEIIYLEARTALLRDQLSVALRVFTGSQRLAYVERTQA